MKLWQKDFNIDQKISDFTIGEDNILDLQLAKYDVQGTMAHIRMLASIGLLEKEELASLLEELEKIAVRIEDGSFQIAAGVEDIHSQIEFELTERLGDLGKKIHAARSRNDQVLLDLRLFYKASIQDIKDLVLELFELLQSKSEQYKAVLMPGYTHTQIAMVSSFGLWFGAFAESLVDDLRMLLAAYDSINQNPLGSAAGYGSSFPINRKMTTELLGFKDLAYNSIYAQMGRGKSELFLSYGMQAIAGTLGQLANDVCTFNSQNFDFFKLPKAFTTGSSIMPHKTNPDVFELIRAKCNLLQSLPAQVNALSTNLISGYHRDYQLLKAVVFPAIQNLKDCLLMAKYVLAEIEVNDQILEDKKYQYLYTVEAVNRLVLEGEAFRTAYQKIGAAVEAGEFTYDQPIHHTHEGSLGNLCNEAVKAKMDAVVQQFE
ncbi:MAG: argininosuccinate lyase [Bacteroidota bacterium]